MPPPSHATAADPDVSIVIPLFDEVENLAELVERVQDAMRPTRHTFELVCIDDGSTDGTDRLLRQLASERPWIVSVVLARQERITAANEVNAA